MQNSTTSDPIAPQESEISPEGLESLQQVLELFNHPAMGGLLQVLQAEQMAQMRRAVSSTSSDDVRLRASGVAEWIQEWISGVIEENYTAQAKQAMAPPKPNGEGAPIPGTEYMEHSPDMSEL